MSYEISRYDVMTDDYCSYAKGKLQKYAKLTGTHLRAGKVLQAQFYTNWHARLMTVYFPFGWEPAVLVNQFNA